MAVAASHITLNASTSTLLATGALDAYITVSSPAFIGPSGVTAATGLPVLPGALPLRVTLAATEVLHGISAAPPNTASVVASVMTANAA